MKVKIYMSTLLALTIQVMVNGQTPGSQIHKTRMDIMGNQKAMAAETLTISSPYTINIEMDMLMEQTQELSATAQKLREEAAKAEHLLLLKKIEVSGLSAQFHYDQFDQNKKAIAQFLCEADHNTYRYASAESMNGAAGRFMKAAREMREEANAQLTDEAKYGNMTNAEQFELLALNKQEEIFALLRQSNAEAIPTLVKTQPGPGFISAVASPGRSQLEEALQQAAGLQITAAQLREAASAKEGGEKELMLAEARGMDREYILKQIEASELSAAMHDKTFHENKMMIAAMAANIKDNEALNAKIEDLSLQAERFLRMGKEMREEANAQFTMAARYGDMSNAEEEEALAIGAQQQVLDMLGQASLHMACR